MNKFFLKLLLIATIFILIVSILNISVITKQGINYQVYEIRMPLFLKLLDFIDRHYNYKNLVINILGGTKDDNAKAIKILDWVKANLRKNPIGLPIIDDHPFSIIIRGYGVGDQFEDVFTILCTYAGLESFYMPFRNKQNEVYYISFVKIADRWIPFSAYFHFFVSKNGKIYSVGDFLRDSDALLMFCSGVPGFEAESFLSEIAKIDFKQTSMRANGQSPFRRIIIIIGKFMKKGC